MAIKYHLPDGSETDMVTNSLKFFPVTDGEIGNAEHGNAQLEDRGITLRRSLGIHTCRPARQYQPLGRQLANSRRRDVVPHNLAINVVLANAAGDELGVLSPKIEHKHALVGDRTSGCHIHNPLTENAAAQEKKLQATANLELYRR